MKKNKKLMVVVGCLIAVIGVSFAYFTATMLIGGDGSSADFTTAIIQGSELRVEGNLTFNDLDIYPGHQNVSSIKITASGDNELIPYNVIWEGTNTLNTPLYFTVYKTSSEVDVSASCEQTKGVIDGAMMYYEECSISNIDSLGTSISSGTISTSETKVILAQDEFITSSPTGLTQYYYIILEYPNLDENQNSDIGGSFEGKVTVEGSNAELDINIIAAYVIQEDGTYEQVSDIPQSGYIINTEKSVCSNGATPTGTTPNITINNLTKSGTSCYLYFDISASDVILANYPTQLTRTDFSTTVTEDTTGTIYYEDTSKGRTYYFAGNPSDNWVSFAGFYWRIIRINEDGSLRLIYQGTAANATGTGTQLSSTSAFNTSHNDNMYVGFKYTSGSVHGTGTNSVILTALNTWYTNNLSGYASSIDGNAGFCGDRTPYTNTSGTASGGGTETIQTYYGGHIRLYINKTPTYDCQSEDLYTTSESNNGNKSLTYPIGLISADEVAYAGGVYGTANSSYYLYTGQIYWTLSPYLYSGSAIVFGVNSNGYLGSWGVGYTLGVRPVINLKSSVQISSGDGTSSNPYVIS